jgi:glycosyltransferase involved in cell wall biosynthesis
VILSVVVPTMNKVELLRHTLAALKLQDPGIGRPWEIVVVNDGSTDSTADYLSSLDGTGSDPLLRVVSPPHNVGRAKARNLGANSAQGRWILFMDDDIVAPPGLLSAHLDLLEKHPGSGTIGYAVTDPAIADATHFSYLDSRGVAKLSSGPAPGRFFVTQNAAIPREAFLSIGGFDEEFSSYGFEDMEVAFRLEDQAGVSFQALVHPVPLHAHHHTLDEYLEKKVECGRLSLPQLAQLHPHRIAEMKLHHIIDVPGQAAVGPLGRFVRLLAVSPVINGLKLLVSHWPAKQGHHPVLAPLHHRLMDLLVVLSFRKGVIEADSQG